MSNSHDQDSQDGWSGSARPNSQAASHNLKQKSLPRSSQPASQSVGRTEIAGCRFWYLHLLPLLFLALFAATINGLTLLLVWIFSNFDSQRGSSVFLIQGDDAFSVSQVRVGWVIVFFGITGVLFIGMHTLTGFRTLVSDSSKDFWGILFSSTFVAAFVACIVVGSFWSTYLNPNVGMTRIGFLRPSVEINVRDTIHFYNPANGVTQVLCVGVNQVCKPENGDSTGVAQLLCDVGISQLCHLGDGTPTELVHELTIQPGRTVGIEFDVGGTYQITSKTTPHMNITITVNSNEHPNGGR